MLERLHKLDNIPYATASGHQLVLTKLTAAIFCITGRCCVLLKVSGFYGNLLLTESLPAEPDTVPLVFLSVQLSHNLVLFQ